MTAPPHPSVAWYVGRTRSGKTTLAAFHARQIRAEYGVPIVVIDTTADAGAFGALPRVDSPEELVDRVYRERASCRVLPRDHDHVAQVARLIQAGGDAVLVVDDSSWWIDSSRRAGDLARLIRTHRHPRVSVLLTTQSLSADVPQSCLDCATTIYVLRLRAPASLERLRKMGFDTVNIPDLPLFRAVPFTL